MHRDSITPSITENCLVIFSYKMKVCNNYPDQDYSNGRLVYVGTARKPTSPKPHVELRQSDGTVAASAALQTCPGILGNEL